MSILQKLLDALKERQSWCPYCGGEYVHNHGWSGEERVPCILKGRWFRDEKRDEDDTTDR